MKKKLIAVLFSAFALVTLVCGFAACNSSNDIGNPDDLSYMKQNNEFVVTGLGGYDGSNLVIPSEHDGLPVTSIDDYAFFNCKTITAVTIPDTVTYIGDYAFYYCKYIKNLNIPKNLEYIGDHSFYKCTALENIRYDAVELENSYSTIFNYAGEKGDGITVTIGSYVTEIPDFLFYMTSTSEIVWEDDSQCKSIGISAFYNCTTLTGVSIPEGVISIAQSAFRGCTGLKSVIIPSTITSIESSVFYGCTALEDVYFNAAEMADLSSGNYVFYNAGNEGKGLTVTIGSEVKRIPAYLFYPYSNYVSSKLTSVIFDEGCKCESIGSYAFFYCLSITKITIPATMASIESNAFCNCNKLLEICNLSSLSIVAGNSNNGYIGYYAKHVYTDKSEQSCLYTTDGGFEFYDDGVNSYLVSYFGTETDLFLPEIDKKYEIYKNAFYGNSFLTRINISNSVTSIGDYAFYNCTSLTSLTISNSITTIGNYAFYNCVKLENIYFYAVAMNDLSSNNYVFSCAGQNSDGIEVMIGAGVTRIPAYLFCPYYSSSSVYSSYAPKIKSLIYEDNCQCESIGKYAFTHCEGPSVITILENMTSIGDYAFAYCTGVKEINFYATAMEDLSNSNHAFATWDCDDIVVKIGKNVTKIPNWGGRPSVDSKFLTFSLHTLFLAHDGTHSQS